MKKLTTLSLLIFISILTSLHAQGKLDKAEKSLQNKETEKKDRSQVRKRYQDDSDHHYLHDIDAYGWLFEVGVIASYGILVETDWERQYSGNFASISSYPYADAKKGNYSYATEEKTTKFRTDLSARYVYESSKLHGAHLNANFWFWKRAGVELNYLQLWEDNVFFGNNGLGIGTVLLKYHRVRTQRFNAWWGAGASYVLGEVKEFGFTYGAGFEFFPVQPISLSSDFNHTFLNKNTLLKWNGMLHYHIGNYAIGGGYEYQKIGDQHFSTITAGLKVSL